MNRIIHVRNVENRRLVILFPLLFSFAFVVFFNPTLVENYNKLLTEPVVPVMQVKPPDNAIYTSGFGVNGDSSTDANTISVKDFGAKGDGVTDDYQAMKDAAAYLSAHPGYTLVYPPGTYYIARFRITGGPNENNVTNIVYDHCKNVTITGYGAIIDVFATFKRTRDWSNYVASRDTTYWFSYKREVEPFHFKNSSNFTVKGFELNGNAQNTTRDAKLSESPNNGIHTSSCSNYTLKDINVHHFLCDGIYLGGAVNKTADRNATLDNVNAHHNARNNLSIIQVRGALIKNSTFANAAITEGTYGGHNPKAGVDIEPNYTTKDKKNTIDVNTGDLVFDSDTFKDNVGVQLVGGNTDLMVDNVTVQNSKFSNAPYSSPYVYYLVYDGLVQNNTFSMHGTSFVRFYAAEQAKIVPSWKLVVQNNTFNTEWNQLFNTIPDDPTNAINNIVLTNNTINLNPPTTQTYLLRVSNFAEFSSNKISMSAAAMDPRVSNQIAVTFINVPSIHDNSYTTDLTGPKKFLVNYASAGSGSSIFSENFLTPSNFAAKDYTQNFITFSGLKSTSSDSSD